MRADVWAAYGRLRSVRAVADALGIPAGDVRKVLEADRSRLRVLLDELHEERAATWQARERRVGAMLDSVLDTYDGLLTEIADAMRDGRVTSIMSEDGARLPVLDAIQLVVMSRIADQTVRIAQMSRALATAGTTFSERMAATAPDGSDRGIEDYDDEELAAAVEEAGMKIPPMLAAKLKYVENTAARRAKPRRG